MDRFFVITNETRDPGAKRAKQIVKYLRSLRKECDHVSIVRDSTPDSDEMQKIRQLLMKN